MPVLPINYRFFSQIKYWIDGAFYMYAPTTHARDDYHDHLVIKGSQDPKSNFANLVRRSITLTIL